MSIVAPLLTARLRLEPVDEAMIAAADLGRAALEARLGAKVPDLWQGYVFEPGRRILVGHRPHYAIVVHREEGLVIGDVRFEPQRAGSGIEIGYAIIPTHRRRGYAVEAVSAVIAALAEAGAPHLIAGCAMKNLPSVRTLRRLGFTLDGSSKRGGAFWWVRTL